VDKQALQSDGTDAMVVLEDLVERAKEGPSAASDAILKFIEVAWELGGFDIAAFERCFGQLLALLRDPYMPERVPIETRFLREYRRVLGRRSPTDKDVVYAELAGTFLNIVYRAKSGGELLEFRGVEDGKNDLGTYHRDPANYRITLTETLDDPVAAGLSGRGCTGEVEYSQTLEPAERFKIKPPDLRDIEALWYTMIGNCRATAVIDSLLGIITPSDFFQSRGITGRGKRDYQRFNRAWRYLRALRVPLTITKGNMEIELGEQPVFVKRSALISMGRGRTVLGVYELPKPAISPTTLQWIAREPIEKTKGYVWIPHSLFSSKKAWKGHDPEAFGNFRLWLAPRPIRMLSPITGHRFARDVLKLSARDLERVVVTRSKIVEVLREAIEKGLIWETSRLDVGFKTPRGRPNPPMDTWKVTIAKRSDELPPSFVHRDDS